MQSLLTKERPELGLVKFIYVERYASTALDFPHFWQLIFRWNWTQMGQYVTWESFVHHQSCQIPREKVWQAGTNNKEEGPSVLFALL